jgi:hypothetical protein
MADVGAELTVLDDLLTKYRKLYRRVGEERARVPMERDLPQSVLRKAREKEELPPEDRE